VLVAPAPPSIVTKLLHCDRTRPQDIVTEQEYLIVRSISTRRRPRASHAKKGLLVRAVAFQSDKRMLLRICFRRAVTYVSGFDNLSLQRNLSSHTSEVTKAKHNDVTLNAVQSSEVILLKAE